MGNLTDTGRIFYGLAITGIGLPTIFYKDFPYMLFPAQPLSFPALIYITGFLFILVGACIVFEKKIRPVSLLFGFVLLLIFCFFFLPYEFGSGSHYKNILEWDNPGKELALAGGAFVVAGVFVEKNKYRLNIIGDKLMSFGSILFSVPIITFGILHLLYAKDLSTLVPSWIPRPVFWAYLAGIALIGSGISIIFRIKTRLIAALLGSMVFIWFVILHVPRVIHAPVTDLEGEATSAFLALAYSGTAFVIAGAYKYII
jgi:uncharacterized membrane protein